jgi:hypothetical protein
MKTLAAVVRNHSSEIQILLIHPPEVGYQEGHPKTSVPNRSLVNLYSNSIHSISNVWDEKSSTIQFPRHDAPYRFIPNQLMIQKYLDSFPPDQPLNHRVLFNYQVTVWVSHGRAAASNQKRCRNF